LEDAEDIAAIYNQGSMRDEGIATFETTHCTAHEIREKLLERGDHFPSIVVIRTKTGGLGQRMSL
jgi:L-amino acid N-acyltransferase YncA